MSKSLNRVKPETRILLITSRDLGQVRLTLFAIIRGVKGIEHIGLRLLDKEEVIKSLSKDPLLSEVRFIIDVDELSKNDKILKTVSDQRIKDTLRSTLHILNVVINELVNLITSHN